MRARRWIFPMSLLLFLVLSVSAVPTSPSAELTQAPQLQDNVTDAVGVFPWEAAPVFPQPPALSCAPTIGCTDDQICLEECPSGVGRCTRTHICMCMCL